MGNGQLLTGVLSLKCERIQIQAAPKEIGRRASPNVSSW